MRSHQRRLLLLAVATTGYLLAAWMVAPGFYDGVAPQQPYNWVSPPPQFRSGNKPPEAGGTTVRVGRNGTVDPGTAFTGDGQASLSFIPGSFEPPPGGGSVSVEVKPASTFPDPGQLRFATNVYRITASQPLTKEALVTLRYSDQLPAPSDVYFAAQGGGWTRLGSTGQAAPFNISSRTKNLGYFAAAYAADSPNKASGPRIGGGQTLPIITAAAILIVVLAGVPLALLRRRRETGSEEEEDQGT